jgi:hypothetical protein
MCSMDTTDNTQSEVTSTVDFMNRQISSNTTNDINTEWISVTLNVIFSLM